MGLEVGVEHGQRVLMAGVEVGYVGIVYSSVWSVPGSREGYAVVDGRTCRVLRAPDVSYVDFEWSFAGWSAE
jgi:hypothetical protein